MICPVCKSEMREGIWDWIQKIFTPKSNLDCHRCDNCGHIFVDYKEDGLDFHKNEWRQKFGAKGGVKFNSSFHRRRDLICRGRCQVLEDYVDLKKCKTLLDVGAGGGSFLLMMNQQWWGMGNNLQLEAQEISTHCISYLREKGFKTYDGDFSKINFEKQYDIVTAWHVVEHVQDIQSLAKQVAKITKKYFIVEVPMAAGSNGGYGRNPNTHKQGFNGHYHFFTKESMIHLFKDYFKTVTENKAIQGGEYSLQLIFEK
mgnify:FL=1